MMNQQALNRAKMPQSTNRILNSRSIHHSNKRLSELVKPGMHILDVGCGSGAITYGIAELVGPGGKVVGIDSSEALIIEAKERYQHIPQLSFEVRDIYQMSYEAAFDIVNASRVLQWLDQPELALQRMIRAVKLGGKVLVLDYNHEKLRTEPEFPASMAHFYRRFLDWRSDVGMDNAIADQLEVYFKQNALTQVSVTNQSEKSVRGWEGFETAAGIWAEVAASRGHQLVEDRYLTEAERSAAEQDYREWVRELAMEHEMYLLAVEGVRAVGGLSIEEG
ncbi:class I SAM-dependent methyltransferase [Paenibacillus sp. JSM ZJ436]|uniref:class I SAM-dependent methyltransferase n=1 Tax=Paenibacillus sp. JSM ZJ436 TaxID=3376190 RepID=UPI00379C8EF1